MENQEASQRVTQEGSQLLMGANPNIDTEDIQSMVPPEELTRRLYSLIMYTIKLNFKRAPKTSQNVIISIGLESGRGG